MKKIISLITLVLVLVSCTEEVKFNNPGFQAYRDGILYKGIDVKAYLSTNGSLTIVSLAQDEEVAISTASSGLGTYVFGTSNQNTKATYRSTFSNINLIYETKIVPGPVADIAVPLVSGGTGYVAGTGIATTGGSGLGLTVKTTVVSGVVTAVVVSSPGNNYKAGDVVTITGGGANAKFRVLNVEGSNGQITLTENSGGTVSGNFKFNAVNSDGNPLGGPLVNFQYGTFYKVPVLPAP